jgi:hypothetical protein
LLTRIKTEPAIRMMESMWISKKLNKWASDYLNHN